MNSRQEVNILVRGIHERPGEEREEVDTHAKGVCFEKEDTVYLSFKETDPETGEETDNLIRYNEGLLEVTKKGHTCVKMVFDLRKVTDCSYQTPYGILPMSIRTSLVKFKRDEDGITIRVKYQLLWNGASPDGGDSMIIIEADPV